MKTLTFSQTMKILRDNGFSVEHSSGSHYTLSNDAGRVVIVPFHGTSRQLKIGTFLSIVRQSGLPKKAFSNT